MVILQRGKMKGKIQIISILLTILFIPSCNDNSEGPDSGGNSAKYPVALNNEWEYATEQHYSFYDSNGNVTHDSTAEFANSIVRISGKDQNIEGHKGLIKFEEYFIDDPGSMSQTWYESSDTALVAVAYKAYGRSVPVLPKKGRRAHLTLSELRHINGGPFFDILNSATSDSILFYAVPREVLAYPISVGKKWTELVIPFQRSRFIQRKENVDVNGVTYDCFVVESDWKDFNIEFTDYVNEKYGLVMRKVIGDSVALADSQHPDGNGNWIKLNTVSRLVRHNISD